MSWGYVSWASHNHITKCREEMGRGLLPKDGLAPPDPQTQWSSRQQLKASMSQSHMIGREKNEPCAISSGRPSQCQVQIHKSQWRLIPCSAHQFVLGTPFVVWHMIPDQRQGSRSPCSQVSGIRRSTCTLYPGQHQCYRINLDVWIESHFAFGKEPFSNQALNSKS